MKLGGGACPRCSPGSYAYIWKRLTKRREGGQGWVLFVVHNKLQTCSTLRVTVMLPIYNTNHHTTHSRLPHNALHSSLKILSTIASLLLNRKPNHITIFICTAFWFTLILRGQRKQKHIHIHTHTQSLSTYSWPNPLTRKRIS